ncbi:MAG: ABC transporter ATP-binding protein [Burkholderiaceae bacterium]|nr:ABC transporter ATP-binding protein [Burkholderiaceae bacterium]
MDAAGAATVWLRAEALSFGHAGRAPLGQAVHLALHPGALLCLLGPNGAGKTTLLRTLLGLLPARAGRIWLDGRPLAALRPVERARLLAYVPQAAGALLPLPVEDVVLMGRTAHLRPLRDPAPADRRAAAAALERLQIGPLAGRRFDELSGGERQLVLLARALAQQARVLLLDEPCAGLDPGHQVRLLQALRDLACDGHALLFTSHLPEHALALQAQALLLADGRLDGPAPAATLLAGPRLSALYGTPMEVAWLRDGPAAGQPVCVPLWPGARPLPPAPMPGADG